MAPHPEVAADRAAHAEAGTPPSYAQTLAEARAAHLAAIRAGTAAVEPAAEVRDKRFPGPAGELPLRVYRPAGPDPSGLLMALVVTAELHPLCAEGPDEPAVTRAGTAVRGG